MKKNTGQETAYLHIRNIIITDENAIGRFLSEREIAESLGLSRTPVREALMRLASEDLIELIPNKGAFVAPSNIKKITDLFQARSMVETWCADFCIKNNIDPSAEMQIKLDEQAALPLDAPLVDLIECDRAFHYVLIEAADNIVMKQIYDLLHARHVAFGIRAVRHNAKRRLQVIKEHQKIIDALKAKNLNATSKAIINHLNFTKKLLG